MYYFCNAIFLLELLYIILWIIPAELVKLNEQKNRLIQPNTCSINVANHLSIYILFEVNPSEGFNLRRDVYLRFALFVHYLGRTAKYKQVTLVLPPFPRLHHWKSNHLKQENIPWSEFFDMTSLQAFAPVIDFNDFVREVSPKYKIPITVYKLKQFEETISNGRFVDKFVLQQCAIDDKFQYPLLKQNSLNVKGFHCLFFQGSVNSIEKIIKHSISNGNWSKRRTYGFLNAEIVLHDQWGSREYWIARKSMKFNNTLVQIAFDFRKQFFNSPNKIEKIKSETRSYRGAIGGGDYLCIHLRRGDFINGRERTTPTLKSAAAQIKSRLRELNLTSVFVSSDCTELEFKNLKSYLKEITLYRFSTENLKPKFMLDGAVAIIDQIICSHSGFFIGTFGSTFTYRIYEEREILGFHTNTTFNTFCKMSNLENCPKNAVWPIVH